MKIAQTYVPCPWSGDGPGLHKARNGTQAVDHGPESWVVFCLDCGANGPEAENAPDAILAWNSAGDALRLALTRDISDLKAQLDAAVSAAVQAEAEVQRVTEAGGARIIEIEADCGSWRDQADMLTDLGAKAAEKIAALEAEVERLTTCLKKANGQAEHFEREWYLRGDEIARLERRRPAVCPSCGNFGVPGSPCRTCKGTGAVFADEPAAQEGGKEE